MAEHERNWVVDLAAVTVMIPDKCGRRLETVRVGCCCCMLFWQRYWPKPPEQWVKQPLAASMRSLVGRSVACVRQGRLAGRSGRR